MDLHAYDVPEDDRVRFLQCMALVARADGELGPDETATLTRAMVNWGLGREDIEAVEQVLAHGGDVLSLAAAFTAPHTPLLLVQELVTLALLDDHYDVAEQKAVAAIAEAAGVSAQRVAAIESWVRDGIAWRARGIELLEPEGV